MSGVLKEVTYTHITTVEIPHEEHALKLQRDTQRIPSLDL